MNPKENAEPSQNQDFDQSPVSGQIGQGRDFVQMQNSSGNQIIQVSITYPEPFQPVPPATTQEVQNRQKLIDNLKSEIADRLQHSLHNINPLNLRKQEQRQQVQPSWDGELKTGKSGVILPSETTIVNVFDQKAIWGRLLILGAPGSGKTTALLELAEVLIERAEQNPGFPVPVLFSLASWQKDEQSMAEWMVTQLKERQGVSKKLGQEWLKNGQVLPLFDGLDELKSERQERCVRAINQFVQDFRLQHWVVCSRREEYERCSTKLELQGAVCLLPLTEEQIREYLRRTSCMDFWQHLQQDSNLLELAKTPLFLNVIALAYSEIALEEWQKLESSAARQQYLFDAYIERMLKRDPISKRWYRRGQEPSAEQTKHWLRFLAKQLKAEGRTEFLIEKMQPTWLKNRCQRLIYRLIFSLILGLVLSALLVWILRILGLISALILGLTTGLILGIVWELILGLSKVETEIETFYLSWTQAKRKKFFAQLILGLIVGLGLGLSSGAVFGLVNGVVGLISGLMGGILFGLKVDIQSRTQPNQGIWQSAKNTLAIALCTLPVWTLSWISFFEDNEIPLSIVQAIIPGFCMALIAGISFSGIACIQHCSLRLILWLNGSIPWDYARFLNCATERLLLQRVGGGYRFMHDLLREHFATQV
jgi:DNA polymerase III delta prime subunit